MNHVTSVHDILKISWNLKLFCISTLENDNKVFSITITRLYYQPNVGQAGAVFLSLLRVDRLFITKSMGSFVYTEER